MHIDIQQTRLSSEVVKASDNNRFRRASTCDMSGRDSGSTDNIARISSTNDAL